MDTACSAKNFKKVKPVRWNCPSEDERTPASSEERHTCTEGEGYRVHLRGQKQLELISRVASRENSFERNLLKGLVVANCPEVLAVFDLPD